MAKKRNSIEDMEDYLVIGIGASAGGLQALEEFFRALPTDTGGVFVVVQHLSPDYPSQLTEILARYTTMPVYQIIALTPLTPNTVYIIPPKFNLVMNSGKLELIEITELHSTPAKIDVFFQSLAEDQHETAVGIILSGTGTDGVLGMRKIKEMGGMTMAQSPDTAKYPAMPQAAIQSGMVDLVAPANELPLLLTSYIHNTRILPTPPLPQKTSSLIPLDSTIAQTDVDYMNYIFKLLLDHTGHDFSLYKGNTVARRIARHMALNKLAELSEYVDYLQQNPPEIEALFQELLIGVTQFFRDPIVFSAIREKVLPQLLTDTPSDQPLRVWVAGCSTGEEAYSIAITLYDFLGAEVAEQRVQIFATDINPQAVDYARHGKYPLKIAQDIEPEYLEKYFVLHEKNYQIKTNIRKLIIFAEHDILRDPPFSHLSLVSCRNVLIYLKPETQRKVLAILRYALQTNGFLCLGSSEALGSFRDIFSSIDSTAKIFRVCEGETGTRAMFEIFPNKRRNLSGKEESSIMPTNQVDFRPLIEKLLLQDFVASCVIVNRVGDILYFHNRTGKYLEPPMGEAKLNVLQMALPSLQMALTTAFHKAVNEKQDFIYENLEVITDDKVQLINLIIHPLQEPPPLKDLLLIMFEDVRQPAQQEGEQPTEFALDTPYEQRVLRLERELKATQEFLQTTTEELETANEELKSTNEELQSANEELQSANEELETSREEINSVNEELISANTELQTKIERLSHVNNDLQNLLNNVEVGIIFLDYQLNIRRFNPAAKGVFNLIESDVGRPITHITSTFEQEHLTEQFQGVLSNLTPQRLEISASSKSWYEMQICPYRTIDNIIDGVVITFSDITHQKQTQTNLRQLAVELEEAHNYANSIISAIRYPLIVLDNHLKVISGNQAFFQLFEVTPEETIGKPLSKLGNGQWNIPKLKGLLKDIFAQDSVVEDFKVEHEFPEIGYKKIQLHAHKLEREADREALILLILEDISD